MDETLEKLVQVWLDETEDRRNHFSPAELQEARAQMQAAALVVLAASVQKLVLYTNQVIDGNESIHVTQEGDW